MHDRAAESLDNYIRDFLWSSGKDEMVSKRNAHPLAPKDLFLTAMVLAELAILLGAFQYWYSSVNVSGNVPILPFVMAFVASFLFVSIASVFLLARIVILVKRRRMKRSDPREKDFYGGNVQFRGVIQTKNNSAPPQFSKEDIESLRMLIGNEIAHIACLFLHAEKSAYRAIRPSLRLGDDKGFLRVEPVGIQLLMPRTELTIEHARLNFRFDEKPAVFRIFGIGRERALWAHAALFNSTTDLLCNPLKSSKPNFPQAMVIPANLR